MLCLGMGEMEVFTLCEILFKSETPEDSHTAARNRDQRFLPQSRRVAALFRSSSFLGLLSNGEMGNHQIGSSLFV